MLSPAISHPSTIDLKTLQLTYPEERCQLCVLVYCGNGSTFVDDLSLCETPFVDLARGDANEVCSHWRYRRSRVPPCTGSDDVWRKERLEARRPGSGHRQQDGSEGN